MSRAHNFCAGPAALPEPVLERARAEFADYAGRGLSVLEMSHRGADFTAIARNAEAALRRLLGIDERYAVLFLQGGASLQFAMAPLNLAGAHGRVAFLDSGHWSRAAIDEARRHVQVTLAASTEADGYRRAPERFTVDGPVDYLHYTPNETIGGVEYARIPDAGEVPLVGDFSSTLLSRPLDVSRFGLIYAGAQKNIGPAGLTVVIVDRSLLGRPRPGTPTMLDYAVHAEAGSMYNTPPTFAWYLAGLVFEWIEGLGGLAAMAERNERKARTLYGAIDAGNFYTSPVDPAFRSWMNVPFTLADPALDGAFLEGAEARGLLNLKGHRSVGGMRASLYNAVPQEAVDALVDWMREFEREHA